jgi:hypothetical protein
LLYFYEVHISIVMSYLLHAYQTIYIHQLSVLKVEPLVCVRICTSQWLLMNARIFRVEFKVLQARIKISCDVLLLIFHINEWIYCQWFRLPLLGKVVSLIYTPFLGTYLSCHRKMNRELVLQVNGQNKSLWSVSYYLDFIYLHIKNTVCGYCWYNFIWVLGLYRGLLKFSHAGSEFHV